MESDKSAFKVGDKVKVHTVDGIGEVALIIPALCEPRREVFRHLPITSGVKVAIRHADEGKDTLRDHVSYIVQFYRSGLTFYSWPKVKNITLADKGVVK
jgi:hypothetical protein